MNKVILPILVAMIVSLMAVPAAWAGGGEKAAELTKQCQETLKQNAKTDAARLCQEGIKLHEQGKTAEAVSKMQQGLAKLQPAKGQKK